MHAPNAVLKAVILVFAALTILGCDDRSLDPCASILAGFFGCGDGSYESYDPCADILTAPAQYLASPAYVDGIWETDGPTSCNVVDFLQPVLNFIQEGGHGNNEVTIEQRGHELTMGLFRKPANDSISFTGRISDDLVCYEYDRTLFELDVTIRGSVTLERTYRNGILLDPIEASVTQYVEGVRFLGEPLVSVECTGSLVKVGEL